MLINSIINEDLENFQNEFEARMFDKLTEAIDVLTMIEGKKLLLGKEKDQDDDDDDEEDLDESSKLAKRGDVKSYVSGKGKQQAKITYDDGASSNLKQRNTKWHKKFKDGYGSNKRQLKADVKGNKAQSNYHDAASFKRFRSENEELDEASLLLKQNKRARHADKALQKGAVRGDSVSTLKGYRAKTKYHNMDTVNRFRKKSGQEPLGKVSKYRDKINALKAKNPKRLPEEEKEEIKESRARQKNFFPKKGDRGDKSTQTSEYSHINRKLRKTIKNDPFGPVGGTSNMAKFTAYKLSHQKRKMTRDALSNWNTKGKSIN